MTSPERTPLPVVIDTGVEYHEEEAGFRFGPGTKVIDKGGEAFEKALDSITDLMKASAERVSEKLHEAKSVTLSCGLSLSLSGNVIFAEMTAQGDFSIDVTWEK